MDKKLLISIPEELHKEFRKKLIDLNCSQRFFWEKQIDNFVNGGEDIFIIPDYFIKHLKDDKVRARQVLFSLIHSYVNEGGELPL